MPIRESSSVSEVFRSASLRATNHGVDLCCAGMVEFSGVRPDDPKLFKRKNLTFAWFVVSVDVTTDRHQLLILPPHRQYIGKMAHEVHQASASDVPLAVLDLANIVTHTVIEVPRVKAVLFPFGVTYGEDTFGEYVSDDDTFSSAGHSQGDDADVAADVQSERRDGGEGDGSHSDDSDDGGELKASIATQPPAAGMVRPQMHKAMSYALVTSGYPALRGGSETSSDVDEQGAAARELAQPVSVFGHLALTVSCVGLRRRTTFLKSIVASGRNIDPDTPQTITLILPTVKSRSQLSALFSVAEAREVQKTLDIDPHNAEDAQLRAIAGLMMKQSEISVAPYIAHFSLVPEKVSSEGEAKRTVLARAKQLWTSALGTVRSHRYGAIGPPPGDRTLGLVFPHEKVHFRRIRVPFGKLVMDPITGVERLTQVDVGPANISQVLRRIPFVPIDLTLPTKIRDLTPLKNTFYVEQMQPQEDRQPNRPVSAHVKRAPREFEIVPLTPRMIAFQCTSPTEKAKWMDWFRAALGEPKVGKSEAELEAISIAERAEREAAEAAVLAAASPPRYEFISFRKDKDRRSPTPPVLGNTITASASASTFEGITRVTSSYSADGFASSAIIRRHEEDTDDENNDSVLPAQALVQEDPQPPVLVRFGASTGTATVMPAAATALASQTDRSGSIESREAASAATSIAVKTRARARTTVVAKANTDGVIDRAVELLGAPVLAKPGADRASAKAAAVLAAGLRQSCDAQTDTSDLIMNQVQRTLSPLPGPAVVTDTTPVTPTPSPPAVGSGPPTVTPLTAALPPDVVTLELPEVDLLADIQAILGAGRSSSSAAVKVPLNHDTAVVVVGLLSDLVSGVSRFGPIALFDSLDEDSCDQVGARRTTFAVTSRWVAAINVRDVATSASLSALKIKIHIRLPPAAAAELDNNQLSRNLAEGLFRLEFTAPEASQRALRYLASNQGDPFAAIGGLSVSPAPSRLRNNIIDLGLI